MITAIFRSGLLLPESVLTTPWFAVLASFVALNTVLYVCLALIKIFPAPHVGWGGGRSRRSETRSIHPDAEV